MKHNWWVALLLIPALLLHSGCDDEAAMRAAARKEKQQKEEYKAAYEGCESTYNMALAKEKANVLNEAEVLYTQASGTAAQWAGQPGEFKLKFMNIQSQSLAAVTRVKEAIATNEKIAQAKADLEKRDKETADALAAKEKELKAKQAQGALPPTGVATTMANVGDVTGAKPAVVPGAQPAAGGDDDDPLDAAPKAGADGAKAAGNGPKVPSDPFTPLDDKAAFKCYAVKSAKRYVIAYCLVRNTSTKELRIVRPVCEFATDKAERTWPVVAMFDYKSFKAENWDDLDKDNPEPKGNEQISLAPGDACKLVLMSDKAERDGEYAKAVKLTGSILWSDATESIVINNN